MTNIMKQITTCTIILLTIAFSLSSKAQTLRGTVKNDVTGKTLPFATVAVISTDKNSLENVVASATTDTSGKFEIKNIPTGRYSIEARFVGYEPERIIEVLISGKRSLTGF